MCLYFTVTMAVLVWTVVTKPFQLLVSHMWVALRTIAHSVSHYTLVALRTIACEYNTFDVDDAVVTESVQLLMSLHTSVALRTKPDLFTAWMEYKAP